MVWVGRLRTLYRLVDGVTIDYEIYQALNLGPVMHRWFQGSSDIHIHTEGKYEGKWIYALVEGF